MRWRRHFVGLVAALIAGGGLLAATAPNAGAAPIALVQQSSTASAGVTSNTVTLTSSPAAGSLLVLLFRNGTDTNDVTSVTGGGVTWVKARSWTTPEISDIWYGAGASGGGGTAITINLSGPTAGHVYTSSVSEWSGVATTNPLDGNPPTTSGTSTTPTTPSITPTVPGELFIGLIATNGSFTPGAVGGGFTALSFAGANGVGFLIATDASAHAMSWASTSAAFTAGLVSFRPTAAPSPPPAAPPTVTVVTPRFTG